MGISIKDIAALPPVELLDIPRSLLSSATTTPSSSNRRAGSTDLVSRPFKRLRRSSSSSTIGGSSSPTNPFIVRSSAPEQRPKLDSPFAMLMQLDASGNAVLTEAEFRKLFVRCLDCKLYTTPAAFEDHRCRLPSASAEIIDS
ncbi:hypothetical protein R3P38DRAFT_3231908 [Favolaschia claudopus]|uniref:EF-hand domain-containing protein n=1 Tax=Favolaschia claudopus TaxID=2862362 RepID=A0AAV9ZJP3_9AGAR